jgi:hypothetical protein
VSGDAMSEDTRRADPLQDIKLAVNNAIPQLCSPLTLCQAWPLPHGAHLSWMLQYGLT